MLRTRSVWRAPLLLAAGIAAAMACAGESVTKAPVTTLVLTPDNASLLPGGSVTLRAEVRGENGESVDSLPLFWSSSDPAIASVTSSGVVTAHRLGEARIAATATGVSAVANVAVRALPPPPTPKPVATVSVGVSAAQLKVGATRQATVVTRASDGMVLTGRAVTWRSADDRIATVSSSGVITGRRNGSTVITATSEGKSGSVTMQVRKDD